MQRSASGIVLHDLSISGYPDKVTITFDAKDISIGNDGIGSYEYWGFKGYDRGRNFVEDFTVIRATLEVDEEAPVDYTKPFNGLLERNTDLFEKACTAIEEELDRSKQEQIYDREEDR